MDPFLNFKISMVAASRCFYILLRCKTTFIFSSSLVRGLGNRVSIPHYPPHNYFTCIRLFCPIVSKIVGNYNSLATQAAPDDEGMADEFLNQILATYRNAPNSSILDMRSRAKGQASTMNNGVNWLN